MENESSLDYNALYNRLVDSSDSKLAEKLTNTDSKVTQIYRDINWSYDKKLEYARQSNLGKELDQSNYQDIILDSMSGDSDSGMMTIGDKQVPFRLSPNSPNFYDALDSKQVIDSPDKKSGISRMRQYAQVSELTGKPISELTDEDFRQVKNYQNWNFLQSITNRDHKFEPFDRTRVYDDVDLSRLGYATKAKIIGQDEHGRAIVDIVNPLTGRSLAFELASNPYTNTRFNLSDYDNSQTNAKRLEKWNRQHESLFDAIRDIKDNAKSENRIAQDLAIIQSASYQMFGRILQYGPEGLVDKKKWASIANSITGQDIADFLAGVTKATRSDYSADMQIFNDEWDRGNYITSLRYAVSNLDRMLAESAPQMGAMAVGATVASALGATGIGALLIGAMTAAIDQTASDIEDYKANNNGAMPSADKIAIQFAKQTAALGIEGATLGKVFGKFLPRKVGAAIRNEYKANPVSADIKGVVTGTIGEGAQEGLQQTISDTFSQDQSKPLSFLDRLLSGDTTKAAVLGSLMGGSLATLGTAIGAKSHAQIRAAMRKAEKTATDYTPSFNQADSKISDSTIRETEAIEVSATMSGDDKIKAYQSLHQKSLDPNLNIKAVEAIQRKKQEIAQALVHDLNTINDVELRRKNQDALFKSLGVTREQYFKDAVYHSNYNADALFRQGKIATDEAREKARQELLKEAQMLGIPDMQATKLMQQVEYEVSQGPLGFNVYRDRLNSIIDVIDTLEDKDKLKAQNEYKAVVNRLVSLLGNQQAKLADLVAAVEKIANGEARDITVRFRSGYSSFEVRGANVASEKSYNERNGVYAVMDSVEADIDDMEKILSDITERASKAKDSKGNKVFADTKNIIDQYNAGQAMASPDQSRVYYTSDKMKHLLNRFDNAVTTIRDDIKKLYKEKHKNKKFEVGSITGKLERVADPKTREDVVLAFTQDVRNYLDEHGKEEILAELDKRFPKSQEKKQKIVDTLNNIDKANTDTQAKVDARTKAKEKVYEEVNQALSTYTKDSLDNTPVGDINKLTDISNKLLDLLRRFKEVSNNSDSDKETIKKLYDLIQTGQKRMDSLREDIRKQEEEKVKKAAQPKPEARSEEPKSESKPSEAPKPIANFSFYNSETANKYRNDPDFGFLFDENWSSKPPSDVRNKKLEEELKFKDRLKSLFDLEDELLTATYLITGKWKLGDSKVPDTNSSSFKIPYNGIKKSVDTDWVREHWRAKDNPYATEKFFKIHRELHKEFLDRLDIIKQEFLNGTSEAPKVEENRESTSTSEAEPRPTENQVTPNTESKPTPTEPESITRNIHGVDVTYIEVPREAQELHGNIAVHRSTPDNKSIIYIANDIASKDVTILKAMVNLLKEYDIDYDALVKGFTDAQAKDFILLHESGHVQQMIKAGGYKQHRKNYNETRFTHEVDATLYALQKLGLISAEDMNKAVDAIRTRELDMSKRDRAALERFYDSVFNGKPAESTETKPQATAEQLKSKSTPKPLGTKENPISVYCDGSDTGKQQAQAILGYGAVFKYNGKVYAISGAERSNDEAVKDLRTKFPDAEFSNPTMELLALSSALETIANLGIGEHILIRQDWRGVLNYWGLWEHSEGSPQRDVNKGWTPKKKYIKYLVDKAVKAIDTIEANGGSVRLQWVKGHQGKKTEEGQMNDLADEYANSDQILNTFADAYSQETPQETSSKPQAKDTQISENQSTTVNDSQTNTPDMTSDTENQVSSENPIQETSPDEKTEVSEETEESTPEPITSFRGEYDFLSNFYEAMTEDYYEPNKLVYRNAEAAFQAAKFTDYKTRRQFTNLTAKQARAKGRSLKLDEDALKEWNEKKLDVMKNILWSKFTSNKELADALLATGDAKLVEGNDWHDTFWGVDNATGEGANHLGKLLMGLREALRIERDTTTSRSLLNSSKNRSANFSVYLNQTFRLSNEFKVGKADSLIATDPSVYDNEFNNRPDKEQKLLSPRELFNEMTLPINEVDNPYDYMRSMLVDAPQLRLIYSMSIAKDENGKPKLNEKGNNLLNIEFNEIVLKAIDFSVKEVMVSKRYGDLFKPFKLPDHRLASIFGLNESTLTYKQLRTIRNVVKNYGVPRAIMADMIGTQVMKNLGIKAKDDDAHSYYYSRTAFGLGMFALRYAEKLGVLERTEYNKPEKADKNYPLDADHMFCVNIKEKHQAVIDRISEVFKDKKDDNGNVIEKGLITQLKPDKDSHVDRGIRWKKPARVPKKMYVRNTDNLLSVPPKAKKVIEKLYNQEYAINRELVDFVRENREAIEKYLGYQTDKQVAELYFSRQIGAEASNETIKEQLQQLLEAINEYDKLVADGTLKDGDGGIFFEWFMSRNGRFFIDSDGLNPQTNKFQRFVCMPKAIYRTFNYTEKETRLEAFAVAQAFDNVKHSNEDILKIGQAMNALSVEQLEEIRSDIFALSEDDFKKKWNNLAGEGLGLKGVENLAQCLGVIQHFIAKKNANFGLFKTWLAVENDSTTSGYAIRFANMPREDMHKQMAKTGILMGDELLKYGENDIHELKARDDFDDLYESTAKDIKDDLDDLNPKSEEGEKKIEKRFSEFFTTPNKTMVEFLKDTWTKLYAAMPKASAEKVSSALRTLMKSPTMVFGYSGGIKGISENMAYEVMDEFIQTYLDIKKVGMEEYIASNPSADKAKLASIMNTFMSLEKAYISRDGDTLEEALRTRDLDYIKLRIGSSRMDIEKVFYMLLRPTYGRAVDEALDRNFKEYKQVNDLMNQAFITMFQWFNQLYKDRMKDFKNPTIGQVKKVVESLRDMFPSMPTAYGPSFDDGAMLFLKTAKPKGTNSNIAVSDPIGLGKDENGKTKIESETGFANERSEFTTTAKAGAVGSIHWTDGAIMAAVLAKFIEKGITGIHDAVVVSALDHVEITKYMNEVILKTCMDFDIFGTLTGRMLEVTKNYIKRTSENKDLNLDHITDIDALLTAAKTDPDIARVLDEPLRGFNGEAKTVTVNGEKYEIPLKQFLEDLGAMNAANGLARENAYRQKIVVANVDGSGVAYVHHPEDMPVGTGEIQRAVETVEPKWQSVEAAKAEAQVEPEETVQPTPKAEKIAESERLQTSDGTELPISSLFKVERYDYTTDANAHNVSNAPDLIPFDELKFPAPRAVQGSLFPEKVMEKHLSSIIKKQLKPLYNKLQKTFNTMKRIDAVAKKIANGEELTKEDTKIAKRFMSNDNGTYWYNKRTETLHNLSNYSLERTELKKAVDTLNKLLKSPTKYGALFAYLRDVFTVVHDNIDLWYDPELYDPSEIETIINETEDNTDSYNSGYMGYQTNGMILDTLERTVTDVAARAEFVQELHDMAIVDGHKTCSNRHIERLKNTIQMVNPTKIREFVVRLTKDGKLPKGPYNAGHLEVKDGKFTVRLAQDDRTDQVDPITRQSVYSGMSMAETYSHEVVHAGLHFAFTEHLNNRIKFGKEIRQLQELMKAAVGVITADDFMPTDYDPSMESLHREHALRTYNYIFNNPHKETLEGLKEFCAYGLTHERIVNKLASVKTPEKNIKFNNLADRLLYVVKGIFDIVFKGESLGNVFPLTSALISGTVTIKGGTIYDDLAQLTYKMSNADAKAARSLMSQAMKPVEHLFKLTNDLRLWGNKYLGTGIKWATTIGDRWNRTSTLNRRLGTSKWNDAAIVAKSLATLLVSANSRKVVKQVMTDIFQASQQGAIMSILNDITTPDMQSMRLQFLSMINRTIDNDAKSAEAISYKEISEKFGKKKLTELQESSLTYVGLFTDLQCLIDDNMTLDDVLNLVSNDTARHAQIEAFENTLKSNRNYNWLVTQARGLGLFMATGIGHAGQNLNAYNIARGILFDGTLHCTSDEEVLIDKLATLYALDLINPDHKRVFASLNKEGLDYFLSAHKAFVKNSKDGVSLDTGEVVHTIYSSHIIKGYTKALFDTSYDMQPGFITQRKKFEDMGYEVVKMLPKNRITGTKNMALFRRNFANPARRDGAAVKIVGAHAMGTTLRQSAYTIASALDNNQYKPDDMWEVFMKEADAASQEVQRASRQRPLTIDELKEFSSGYTPIISPKTGEAVDYRITMSVEDKVNLLGMDTRGITILSKMFASQEMKAKAPAVNKAVTDFLVANMENNMTANHRDITNNVKYTKITRYSDNKYLRESWNVIPKEIKDKAEELEEDNGDGLWVREDWLHDLFGVENYSITQSMPKDSWTRTKRIIAIAEYVMKTLTYVAKRNIVLFIPQVLIGNIASNYVFNVMNGTNPIKSLSYTLANFRAIRDYMDTKKQLERIKFREKIGKATQTEINSKNTLESILERNRVHPLMKKGMYQAVVEDMNPDELENVGKVIKLIKNWKVAEKVPAPLKWLVKNLYMAEGTFLYNFMFTLTQYSDFVARATEYQSKLEDIEKDTPKFLSNGRENPDWRDKEEQLSADIVREFINYDKPQSKGEQYLNDMGLLFFTKFAKRIQSVITDQITKNPMGVLMFLACQCTFLDVENIMEQHWLVKHWSALPHNPVTNFMSAVIPPYLHAYYGIR